MDFICENIAIGEYEDAVSPQEGITALLCVAEERNLPSPYLPYHKVPVRDMEPMPPEQLRDALFFIRRMLSEGRKVLIFCNQGTGRSPSVAIGYLCCELHYPFNKAIETVADRKGTISILPNLIITIEKVMEDCPC